MPLRETFEEAPELYDRVRPGYPEELFDDLAVLAGLSEGSRVLELGCGTGQATVPLARRGYEVVAVELGAGLAGLARRRLAAFGRVSVVNAAFEAWPLPAATSGSSPTRSAATSSGIPRRRPARGCPPPPTCRSTATSSRRAAASAR